MTARGKIILTLLILGVVGFGAWKWWGKLAPSSQPPQQPSQSTQPAQPSPTTPATATKAAPIAELVETQTETPKLEPAGTYVPKDNVVEVEISEYAGYAGLIVANGGLEPNENSIFFKKHGFKVKLSISEDENWSELNVGKIAASATTVDVLPTYGKQFQIVVPAQIGYSRGADGVVVRSDIKRINGLKGKVLVTCQFTEADFFIRYLAQEAGLEVQNLPDLKTAPDPNKLNLIFTADA